MNKTKPTLGPLERGLKLLNIAARSDAPLSFTEITNLMNGINKATLSKMLKVLVINSYLRKVDGKYACGDTLNVFKNADIPDIGKILIEKYGLFMQEITDEFMVSTILFKVLGSKAISIDKKLYSTAPSMQPLGSVSTAGETAPWTLLLLLEEKKAPSNSIRYKSLTSEYTHEEGQISHGISRMAFPIRKTSGELVGILGLGAQTAVLTNSQAKKIKNRVSQYFSSNLI